MGSEDVKSFIAGAVAWTLAIPAVKIAGKATADREVVKAGNGLRNKVFALIFGVALAATTTPVLSSIFGWNTPSERVRGVAISLGTAQTIDGLVHIFYPDFYSKNREISVACAGNIFLGAGLLGIFSAFV